MHITYTLNFRILLVRPRPSHYWQKFTLFFIFFDFFLTYKSHNSFLKNSSYQIVLIVMSLDTFFNYQTVTNIHKPTHIYHNILSFFSEHKFFSQFRFTSLFKTILIFSSQVFINDIRLFHWKHQELMINRTDNSFDTICRDERHEEVEFPPAKPIGRRYRLRCRNACLFVIIIIFSDEKSSK